MITYQNFGLSPFRIVVFKDDANIGQIRRYDDGYRYEPHGGNPSGMFESVDQVKGHIEETA